MKRNQFILIGAGLLAIILLYVFGNRIGGPKTMVKSEHTGSQNEEKPSMPGQNIPTLTYQEVEKMALNNINTSQKEALNKLQNTGKVSDLEALSKFWAVAKQPNISAKYKADIAKLENTEKSLTFASQYFIALYNNEEDVAVRKWQANQAIDLLTQAQKLNPANEDLKTKIGICYTDGTGETMKGVLMLRELATNNPKNLEAGTKLGALAIQSGQFDKAIDRLEKLVALYPKNTEALYNLAEAFKGQGETEKAKTLFKKCKQLINKPEFSKEVDAYIKTF